VTDRDHLEEGLAELYTADPDEFTERRAALTAQARAAGDAPAARQIAALRKPTRSAWVINQLARSDSSMAARLVGLGDELRAAQASLDGALMRELSVRRRELVDELAQQAFAAAGQDAPPAGLRDDVTATLGAALADPQLAGQLQAGTLVRPVRADNFGLAPALTLVPPPGSTPTTAPHRAASASSGTRVRKQATSPAGKQAPVSARRAATAAVKAEDKAKAKADAEVKARADAEAKAKADQERRSQAVADAEQRAAEAEVALETAADEEHAREREVEQLETQLADALQRLQDARLQARRARIAQRAARQALGRLSR
jgi:chemotaxis protein histidine kinase CheA